MSRMLRILFSAGQAVRMSIALIPLAFFTMLMLAVSLHGLAASGHLGLAGWGALLDRLGRETAVEVSCHPGQADEESAALLSRELAEKLQERVRPRSFRDLVPGPVPPRRLP